MKKRLAYLKDTKKLKFNDVDGVQTFVISNYTYVKDDGDRWHFPWESWVTKKADCEDYAITMIDLVKRYFGEKLDLIILKKYEGKQKVWHACLYDGAVIWDSTARRRIDLNNSDWEYETVIAYNFIPITIIWKRFTWRLIKILKRIKKCLKMDSSR